MDNQTWWQEPLDQIINYGFTYESPAKLAGTYDKHIFKSRLNGKRYLWKSGKRKLGLLSKSGKPRAATSRDKEFTQPNAEDFASKAAHMILNKGEHIPISKLEFPFKNIKGVEQGTLGVIMPFLDDAKSNVFSKDFKTLTPEEIKTIQRMHLFDYLVSNLDTHSETTIKLGGKTIGIDRGQALRYLSKTIRSLKPDMEADTLEREKTPIGIKSFYKEFFDAVRSGEVNVDIADVADIINSVEKISDEKWKELMKDYLEAFKQHYLVAMKSEPKGKPGQKTYWKGLTPEEIDADIEGISNEMVERKNRFRKDVETFYKNLKNPPKKSEVTEAYIKEEIERFIRRD